MPTHVTAGGAPPTEILSHHYLVVAADMAFYDGHSLDYHEMVITRAGDEEAALETARGSLRSGCIPLVALSASNLRDLADQLANYPLKEKESYNLTTGLTDVIAAGSRLTVL